MSAAAHEAGGELSRTLEEVANQFAAGLAPTEQVPGLPEFLSELEAGASISELEPRWRRISERGYLRELLHLVASVAQERARPELCLRLAQELLDAIEPAQGEAIARNLLELPSVQRTRLLDTGAHRRAHLLLAEHLRDNQRFDEARRHYEAILALDIAHPRALAGWRDCEVHLTRAGHRTDRRSQALALIDGLESAELNARIGGERYELGRPLGRGRHAIVYEAWDRQVGRKVALKRLLDLGGKASERRVDRRFFAEARTLARVRSPYVVALFDVQVQQRFIAMSLCEGGNLRTAVRRGALGPAELPRVGKQLGLALKAVHFAGAVHRDIKPANVLVRSRDPDSPIALADFGLALDHRSGAPGGTLRYLAPELRRGGQASPASDLYSAGLVLLELARGSLPESVEVLESEDEIRNAVPPTLPLRWFERLQRLLDPEPEGRSW